ncbi:MAG: endo-1,3-beta-xylanase [Pedobacter sp.]|nr:endo-1,3-beta-xylanase [Pedobacter sp.]
MNRIFFTPFLSLLLIASFASCDKKATKSVTTDSTRLAKFEPANGKVILFTGQDLESIGGTDNYKDGYFDHFPAPGGFTQYTDFSFGSTSYGFTRKSLAGVTTLDNWGDGPESMAITTSHPNFKNSCLAIGLDISNGNDSITAIGGHDHLINRLGTWMKGQGERPIFLRIGYEFDGFDWNHYNKRFYIPAWRRIRTKLDSMGVKNVAYVWQSKGAGATRKVMDDFYPGDKYVDWVAYSFFTAAEEHHPMLKFARDHKKPLFIAEASAVFLDNKLVSLPLDLSKQADAEKAWKNWFVPFFRTIQNNADVVKAVHYINCPWKTRPLWKNTDYFKNIDARITKNDSLKAWWLTETSRTKYLKASDTLFTYLWNKK